MGTAIKTNNAAMDKLFTFYKSNVLADSHHGQTAYHLAACHGHHEVLKVLCDYDLTNINHGNINNRTPMHLAAAYCRIECVKVLLRHHNIDTTIKSTHGNTSYDVAGLYNNPQNRKIIRDIIQDYRIKEILKD